MEAQTDRTVEKLFRQLLAYVDDEASRFAASLLPEPHDVVLTICLDGVNYAVLRTSDSEEEAKSAVSLSPREHEVVRLVAKGLPNRAIAVVLEISPYTVNTHLRRVFSKLGVNSRAELVTRAVQAGLLDANGVSLSGLD